VCCDAHERQRLAQPCRTITRPALANERVQCNAAGQVVLKLKSPWRDGTTPIVMSPLEFMQRLAALVPRPRLHLIRFHGVLAHNAKLRALVVPAAPQATADASGRTASQSACENRAGLPEPPTEPQPAFRPGAGHATGLPLLSVRSARPKQPSGPPQSGRALAQRARKHAAKTCRLKNLFTNSSFSGMPSLAATSASSGDRRKRIAESTQLR